MKLQRELLLLATALQFYTRVPVPRALPFSKSLLNESRKYFSLIGVIVGSFAACILTLTQPHFGTDIAVALSMVASILATGAFHEDGWADSCDGFGGGWDKAQVLTIMKDSRLGTYGAISLVSILALKYLALVNIAALSGVWNVWLILIVAHSFSRQLSSSAIECFEYVQDIDASKVKPITESRLSLAQQGFSIAVCLPAIVLLVWLVPDTVYALALSGLIAYGPLLYSRKRIGGYTGDVLGATQQLSELTFYLSLVVILFN